MKPMSIMTTSDENQAALRASVAHFQAPILTKSLIQIGTSFGCFLAVTAAMYVTAGISYWIAFGLIPLAAGLLVRIFIIQHDCGHGAFFRSRRANDALGLVCSLLTLTPYLSWRRQHAGHHSIWNNLDRRQSGADIYSTCLTVTEYRSLGPWRKLWYRITRHPLVANILLPPLIFLVLYRLPFDMPKSWRRERRAVYLTNLMAGSLIGGLGFLIGFERILAVNLPIIAVTSIVGVWLFSLQHRSESTLWARQAKWNFVDAALQGSSYLRLSRILQWFTGNIGFHHIHHLNPRVPNYRLQTCLEAIPALRNVLPMSLKAGLRGWRFTLWDEDLQKMVTFRAAAAASAGKVRLT